MDCQVCFGNDFDSNGGSYFCTTCGAEKCAQDFVHDTVLPGCRKWLTVNREIQTP